MNILKDFVLNILKKIIRLSGKKKSIHVLGIVSFSESIIFPIPPDLFMIPLVLAKRYSWIYISIYTTLLSVLGGLFGYYIGFFFWDTFGDFVINFYDAKDHFYYLQEKFSKYGRVIIFLAGFTPIPYKIFTITSGFLSFNLFIFIFCSILSRGIRFISLAYLVHKFGDRGIAIIENHFKKTIFIFLIIFIILVFLYYYDFI